MNFPVDSFYDSERDLVHIFFRQGQALSIDPNKMKHVFQQEITEFDLVKELYRRYYFDFVAAGYSPKFVKKFISAIEEAQNNLR